MSYPNKFGSAEISAEYFGQIVGFSSGFDQTFGQSSAFVELRPNSSVRVRNKAAADRQTVARSTNLYNIEAI